MNEECCANSYVCMHVTVCELVGGGMILNLL